MMEEGREEEEVEYTSVEYYMIGKIKLYCNIRIWWMDHLGNKELSGWLWSMTVSRWRPGGHEELVSGLTPLNLCQWHKSADTKLCGVMDTRQGGDETQRDLDKSEKGTCEVP